MLISMIVAMARNRTIGRAGTLPWHLPQDLARFRSLTIGKPVIMGRKTWDSLPERVRPLPQRSNIVVTRQPGWRAPGAITAASLEQALQLAAPSAEAVIIGGAELYRAALPLAQRIHATEIDRDVEGDCFFPDLDPQLWQRSAAEPAHAPPPLDCPFAWVTYDRRPPPPEPPSHAATT
jgi:dihydrofolate reductase